MKATQEQLKRVAPNLDRPQGNGRYYAKLQAPTRRYGPTVLNADDGHAINDFALAKRALRAWDTEREQILPNKRGEKPLAGLLEAFERVRSNKSRSTKAAERGTIEHFRKHFPKPMDNAVAGVVYSDIAIWLSRTGKQGRTYDRRRLFALQLFDLAVGDGIVGKSPFDPKRIARAKKLPVKRNTPTIEAFTKIVNEVRTPSLLPQKGMHGGPRSLRQQESADFAAFLGLAGVGQAEAASLSWEDVEEKRIRFTC